MKIIQIPGMSGLGLVLWVALLTGCASGPREGVLLPSLTVDGKRQWNIGRRTKNEEGRITELVRPGENVEDWTELVIVQTFDRASVALVPLSDMPAVSREALVSRNPGSTVIVIREEPNSLLYESYVRGSGDEPDQQNVARILDGRWKRFVITYAVRSPLTMTPERRAEWIEWLMETSILTDEGGEKDE